jgi:hypothetical protein
LQQIKTCNTDAFHRLDNGSTMPKNIPSDVTNLWNNVYEHLHTTILEELKTTVSTEQFTQQIQSTLNIKGLVAEHIDATIDKQSEKDNIASLLQVISLLEEKARAQDKTIKFLSERLEKLEEENLQTRIEAAKHHLDSMEKLALLQHKLNAR